MNNFKTVGNNMGVRRYGMPLIGIVAKKKDIHIIKNELKGSNVEIIEITKQCVKNLKNITFEEVIFLEDISLNTDEYKYMNEIISKAKYIIFNSDIKMKIFKQIEIQKPVKFITFGFNSKSTITISSIKEEKVIVCIQRNIEKINGKILEIQEKEILSKNTRKIYNYLVVFIIKELHNQQKIVKMAQNDLKNRKN